MGIFQCKNCAAAHKRLFAVYLASQSSKKPFTIIYTEHSSPNNCFIFVLHQTVWYKAKEAEENQIYTKNSPTLMYH